MVTTLPPKDVVVNESFCFSWESDRKYSWFFSTKVELAFEGATEKLNLMTVV